MNDLQVKAMRHLTEPNHPQRLLCLEDLITEGWFFRNVTENAFLGGVASYLDANKRGFCKDGIQRFKDALGIVPQDKVYLEGVSWTVKKDIRGYVTIKAPISTMGSAGIQPDGSLTFGDESKVARAVAMALKGE